jgi:hypothetical protein
MAAYSEREGGGMECNRCAFSKKIAEGKVSPDTPYEKTPCFKCPSVQGSGKGVLEYEEWRAEVTPSPPEEDSGEVRLPISVLCDLAMILVGLSPLEHKALKLRREGMSYKAIAKKLKISENSANRSVLRVLQRHPAMKHLIPVYVGRDEWRKKLP